MKFLFRNFLPKYGSENFKCISIYIYQNVSMALHKKTREILDKICLHLWLNRSEFRSVTIRLWLYVSEGIGQSEVATEGIENATKWDWNQKPQCCEKLQFRFLAKLTCFSHNICFSGQTMEAVKCLWIVWLLQTSYRWPLWRFLIL